MKEVLGRYEEMIRKSKYYKFKKKIEDKFENFFCNDNEEDEDLLFLNETRFIYFYNFDSFKNVQQFKQVALYVYRQITGKKVKFVSNQNLKYKDELLRKSDFDIKKLGVYYYKKLIKNNLLTYEDLIVLSEIALLIPILAELKNVKKSKFLSLRNEIRKLNPQILNEYIHELDIPLREGKFKNCKVPNLFPGIIPVDLSVEKAEKNLLKLIDVLF